MPKGYIVAELHNINPGSEFREYRDKVLGTVEAYGGRFLIRGGDPKLLEGNEPLGRVIVLEFDSQERAIEWYHSPAYQAILPLRLRNSSSRVTCSAGV